MFQLFDTVEVCYFKFSRDQQNKKLGLSKISTNKSAGKQIHIERQLGLELPEIYFRGLLQ